MSHGPVLMCFECDEREDVSGGETVCNIAFPLAPRVLPDSGITPDWCPLRAAVLRILSHGAFDQKPLLSGDYGFDDDGEDPDD